MSLEKDEELRQLAEIEGELGDRKSVDTALNRLNQLANEGSTKAMLKFAALFEENQIFARDYSKVRECLEEADKLGDEEAAYQLGRLYRLGLGVSQDSEMALYYFQKSAKRGHSRAAYQAAVISLDLGWSEGGVKLLIKSINAGISEARYDYAICLMNGEGVARDIEKAVRILESCARDGDEAASERLAFMYKTGTLVPRNPEKAQYYKSLLML